MFKVLCVDDNSALVEVLSEMLSSLAYDPRAVLGGQECLDLLDQGKFEPDVILLDIMMAPMDGWTTLKNIRSNQKYSMIPVLMLTGKYPTMAEVNEYCTMFEKYLMKPFALESLSCELSNVLNYAKKRESIIQDAKDKGVAVSILDEYRKLSSAASVLGQFEKIITDGTFSKENFRYSELRLESIVRQLKEIKSIHD